MKTLRIYLSAFFDLFAQPRKEDLINEEPPIRTWKSMIVPVLILMLLVSLIVISRI